MKYHKIDQKILNEIEILGIDKKIPCIILSKKNKFTKDELHKRNINIMKEYPFINSFYCLASQREILNLSDIDNIDFIYSVSTAASQMYVAKKILASNNLNCFGEGIGVAFIDTGIAPHCDFLVGRNRIAYFKDFINNKLEAYDDNGHGTFVCGVGCGSGVLSKFRYSGIAPKASIIALKALNAQGEANANKILDAMEWIFDNHTTYGIRVVCMSFGSEPLGSNDPIMLGADSLWKEGLVVVAAAGNSGPDYQTIKSPGISSKIITVGGIDDNRYDDESYNPKYFEIAEFSSRGPALRKTKPDVVAPSVDIISCGTKTPYTTLSGTSVAAPMIAGLSALLIERSNEASPDKIKNQLISISQPLGFEMYLEGYGLPCLGHTKI